MGGRGGSSSRGGGAAGGGGALPELTGTERQVAWANDIREKFLGNIIAQREQAMASARNAPETQRQLLHEMYDEIGRTDSARFYIDNRDAVSPMQMVDRLLAKRAQRELEASYTPIAGDFHTVSKTGNGRGVTLGSWLTRTILQVRFTDDGENLYRPSTGERREYPTVRDAVRAARRYLESGRIG